LRQRLGGRAAEGGDYGGAGDEMAAGKIVGGWRYRLRSQI
jgi:hypothetical protein